MLTLQLNVQLTTGHWIFWVYHVTSKQEGQSARSSSASCNALCEIFQQSEVEVWAGIEVCAQGIEDAGFGWCAFDDDVDEFRVELGFCVDTGDRFIGQAVSDVLNGLCAWRIFGVNGDGARGCDAETFFEILVGVVEDDEGVFVALQR
jgi:hypothetical protein